MNNANKDKECEYCDDKIHKGFKLVCDYENCNSSFHVSCAVQEDLICDPSSIQTLVHGSLVVLCKEHKKVWKGRKQS